MKSRRRLWKDKRGFSLSELLITIALLGILMAFGAVGVVEYRKTVKLMEMDATAKEIFLSAQNYLAASVSSGEWASVQEAHVMPLAGGAVDPYFGETMKTTPMPSDYVEGDWGTASEDYRYLVYDGNKATLESCALSEMLPYGALDDEVRSGGSYVIEYNEKTGVVYGVFYTDQGAINYAFDISGSGGIGLNHNDGRADTKEGRNTRKNHKDYHTNRSKIIGYYGGAMVKKLSTSTLKAPEVVIKNAEKLLLEIKDENVLGGGSATADVLVTVEGESTHAKQSFQFEAAADNTLKRKYEPVTSGAPTVEKTISGDKCETVAGQKTYTLVLDDVTKSGAHFTEQFPELAPGENLIITVRFGSTKVLAAPVQKQVYTNSLYKDAVAKTMPDPVNPLIKRTTLDVSIENMRHLQNLSNLVSGVGRKVNGEEIQVVKADQLADLDWNVFCNNIKSPLSTEEVQIYSAALSSDRVSGGETVVAKQLTNGTFYSITNTGLLEYNGNHKKITNLTVSVDSVGNAGLFGQVGIAAEVDAGTTAVQQDLAVRDLTLEKPTCLATQSSSTYALTSGLGVVGKSLGISTLTGSEGAPAVRLALPARTVSSYAAGAVVGQVVEGSTFTGENISVTDPTIEAENGEAGGLVGKLSGGTVKDVSVTNPSIKVTNGEAGGLVGKLSRGTVDDVFVTNPVIEAGTGEAGGLAGKLEEGTLKKCAVYLKDEGSTNVADKYVKGAYNLNPESGASQMAAAGSKVTRVYSQSGVAGGLVGDMGATGAASIEDSFASLPVLAGSSTGTAGGVVGTIASGATANLARVYSGGYAENGEYKDIYGVVAYEAGTAGGLIGTDKGQTTITSCYSTAAVYGKTVGGLVGIASDRGKTCSDSYAAGKVGATDGGTTGGFIGQVASGVGITANGCSYLKQQEDVTYTTNLDYASGISYQDLAGKQTGVDRETHVYGNQQMEEGKGSYPFPVVTDTAANTSGKKAHYGDWEKEIKNENPPDEGELEEDDDSYEEAEHEIVEETTINKTYAAGVVYYELVDKEFYYNGYVAEFSRPYVKRRYAKVNTCNIEKRTENTINDNGLICTGGKYATEDGYLLALPKGQKIGALFNLGELYLRVYTQFWGDKSNQEKFEIGDNSSFLQQVNKNSVIGKSELAKKYDLYYIKEEKCEFNYKNSGKSYESKYLTIKLDISPNWWKKRYKTTMQFEPYFADSVKIPTQPGSNVHHIRTARQLLTMQKTRDWSKTPYHYESQTTLIQDLDINFNQDFTKRDSKTTYTYETREGINCTYITNSYVAEDGTQKNFCIKGLNTTMFGKVESSAKLQGMRLQDSTGLTSCGFAVYNNGTIKDCHIDNYTITSNSGAAVGFLKQNEGTIDSCRFSGSVQTNESSKTEGILWNATTVWTGYDAVGFVEENKGTIRNSVFEGTVKKNGTNKENQVSAFVKTNCQNGSIDQCEVRGDISSAKGSASGFVMVNYGSIANSHFIDGKVEASGDATGLIDTSYASSETIRNCAVGSSEQGYCTIRSTSGAATGFIKINHSPIEQSSFTGVVEGGTSASGFVNTSAGTSNIVECKVVHKSEGQNQYTVVAKNGTASGFIGINGGTIRNSQFSGKVKGTEAYGVARQNDNTIDGFSVHAIQNTVGNVQTETGYETGYEDVLVEGTEKVAGAIGTARGTINGVGFTGTVQAKEAVGFSYTTETTIQNSYVNAIIKGETSAIGFSRGPGVGYTNCFVVGSVTADNRNGNKKDLIVAAGFSYFETGTLPTITNCYTALTKLDATGLRGATMKEYPFIGTKQGGTISGGYWLHTPEVTPEQASLDGMSKGIPYTYRDLVNMATNDQQFATYRYGSTNAELAGKIETTPNAVYPFYFPTPASTENWRLDFWGDWPKAPNDVKAVTQSSQSFFVGTEFNLMAEPENVPEVDSEIQAEPETETGTETESSGEKQQVVDPMDPAILPDQNVSGEESTEESTGDPVKDKNVGASGDKAEGKSNTE